MCLCFLRKGNIYQGHRYFESICYSEISNAKIQPQIGTVLSDRGIELQAAFQYVCHIWNYHLMLAMLALYYKFTTEVFAFK